MYQYTSRFPREERFVLVAQMRRAAVSIGSNIFEGTGKKTNAAYAASLYTAFSEAGELLFQLGLSPRLGFGDLSLVKKIRAGIGQVRRMLIRLIRRLEADDS